MKLSQNNTFRFITFIAFTFLVALTWNSDTELWRKIAFTGLFVIAMSDKIFIRK